MKRVSIRKILADPKKRRRLMALTLQANQAREGRDLTLEQAYSVVDRVSSLTGSRSTSNLVNMEQELTKHGAVLCPGCQSDDVELIKTADAAESDGTQERKEEYECRRCQRRFSKRV